MLQDSKMFAYFAKVLAFQLRQKQAFLAGSIPLKNDYTFFNHKSKTFKKNQRKGL